MKNIVKQHPLKPITLSYHESREAPAFELQALKQYEQAHDETWELKVRYESRRGRLMLLKNEMDDLYLGMMPLEQQLEIMEDSLGIGPGLDVPPFEDTVSLDIHAFFEEVMSHNRGLQQLHGRMVKAASDYNADVAALYEENYLIDPAYFDVLDEVYRRYEEVKVDIVSLDQDHQDFLGLYGQVSDLREAYMELGEEVFEAYARLSKQSESLYRRSETVNERLDGELGQG